MTTPLEKPLAREVLLGGEPFKVVLTPTGVRITEKGHRKGAEVTWETILALSERHHGARHAAQGAPEPRASTSDVPSAIAAEVAREVRTANDALQRARAVLARVASVPAALLAERDPDPVYGRVEHQSDWYIEPLLTTDEVASILRLSRGAVRTLPIPSVSVAGEVRYRQSAVRQYLSAQERRY